MSVPCQIKYSSASLFLNFYQTLSYYSLLLQLLSVVITPNTKTFHSSQLQAQTPSFHFTILHSSTPRPIQTSHSSRSDITTCSLRWYFGCIGRISQTYILERNIETWMNVTTTYARSPIPLSSLRISREIHECYIGDFHQRRPRIGTVVT